MTTQTATQTSYIILLHRDRTEQNGNCGKPVRMLYADAKATSLSRTSIRVRCEECGFIREGRNALTGTDSGKLKKCNARCMNAVGPACDCPCKGDNHGKSYDFTPAPHSDPLEETEQCNCRESDADNAELLMCSAHATDYYRSVMASAVVTPPTEHTIYVTCQRCNGRGGWEGWPGFTCYTCQGEGKRPRTVVQNPRTTFCNLCLKEIARLTSASGVDYYTDLERTPKGTPYTQTNHLHDCQ